jgi:hypothetical protein
VMTDLVPGIAHGGAFIRHVPDQGVTSRQADDTEFAQVKVSKNIVIGLTL